MRVRRILQRRQKHLLVGRHVVQSLAKSLVEPSVGVGISELKETTVGSNRAILGSHGKTYDEILCLRLCNERRIRRLKVGQKCTVCRIGARGCMADASQMAH